MKIKVMQNHGLPPYKCQIHCDDEKVGVCSGQVVTKKSHFGAILRACEGAWKELKVGDSWKELK